jgi:hypothetical protein
MSELSYSTSLILAKKALANTIYIQRQLNNIRASTGEFVPAEDNLYDIGTEDIRYSDLYLSNSAVIGIITIHNGGNQANIAIGVDCLYENTLGDRNIAFGYHVLEHNTDGGSNVGIGYSALLENISGAGNIGIGTDALSQNTSGNYNIGIGKSTLYENTTGTYNIGIGYLAANVNTTGIYNIAIGSYTLYSNTTGNYNIALGAEAAHLTTSGIQNITIGNEALHQNTTGRYNIALGTQAAYFTTSGVHNISIGNQALYQNTTGEFNVAIGVSSHVQATTSYDNVAVGNGAFYGATGSSNVAVGRNAYFSGSYNNSTCLGAYSTVTASNQVQLGDSNTTTYVYGTVNDRSDLRDKTDVRDTELGSDFIMSLRPVDFRWDYRDSYKPEKPELFNETQPERTDADTDASYQLKLSAYNVRKANYNREFEEWCEAIKLKNLTHDGTKKRNRYHHGFIAQEVAETGYQFGGYQNHVFNGGDDVLTLGYNEFIAPIVKTLQEFNSRLQILEEYMANNAPNELELESEHDDIFIDSN